MRTSAALPKLKPLLKKILFTSSDARALGVHPSALAYLVKTGKLKRLRHGVYRSMDAPSTLGFRWSDLIEAIRSIPGGTVCLISALAIYDLTEEIPREHWIAVEHHTSLRAPRPLRIIRYRNASLGQTQIQLDGIKIPIFDRERTILDAFRQLSRETAIKALKAAISVTGKNRLDLLKLQKYAKILRVPIAPYLMAVTT